MFTQVHSIKAIQGGASLLSNITHSGGATANLSESIPIGSNVLVAWGIDVSQIKALMIKVSGALTIKTNSSGSPDNTLTFAGAGDYLWSSDNLEPCLLTTDVTKLYVTNGTAGAVTLEILCLYDPTP